MTTRVENKMLSVNFACVGQVAKLANALALGASGAILESSSLSLPTTVEKSIESSDMIKVMSVFFNILGCVNCCVNSKMLPKGRGEVGRFTKSFALHLP